MNQDIIPIGQLKIADQKRESVHSEKREGRLRSNSSTSVATLESFWETDIFRITCLRLFKTELDTIEEDLNFGKPGSEGFCFDYYMHLQRKRDVIVTRINRLFVPSDRNLVPVVGDFDEMAKKAFQILPFAYDIQSRHHICINTFTAKHKDDLVVGLGHKIVIALIFTDGLAHGFNKSTGSTGMLPLSCLSISSPDIRITSLPKHSKTSSATLQYCLVEPPQGLEIIYSLSKYRKHVYFEKAKPKLLTRDLLLEKLNFAFESWTTKRRTSSFWKVIADSYDKE
jgi:hypothetical protein